MLRFAEELGRRSPIVEVRAEARFAHAAERACDDPRRKQGLAELAAIPLAAQWNVSGYPTLYLLDAQGKIRERWLGSPGDEVLDRKIDELVAEAQAKKWPGCTDENGAAAVPSGSAAATLPGPGELAVSLPAAGSTRPPRARGCNRPRDGAGG